MSAPRFSIVVPAHNEEAYIAACFDSIERAVAVCACEAELIVVLNRCTDGTERMAQERGAVLVACDAHNLAAIRNAGAARATGEILITIDADSRMSANTLVAAQKALASGRYIGGGARIRPDRISFPIVLTGVLILSLCRILGVPSAGLFWCYRRDFEAVGGFDESKHAAEDVDFARRLKAYGKQQGKRYGTLRRVWLDTSSRKFDEFGDWFALKYMWLHPFKTWRAIHGLDKGFGDRYWYDVER